MGVDDWVQGGTLVFTGTEAGLGAKQSICVGAEVVTCVGLGTEAAIWVWARAEGVVCTWF